MVLSCLIRFVCLGSDYGTFACCSYSFGCHPAYIIILINFFHWPPRSRYQSHEALFFSFYCAVWATFCIRRPTLIICCPNSLKLPSLLFMSFLGCLVWVFTAAGSLSWVISFSQFPNVRLWWIYVCSFAIYFIWMFWLRSFCHFSWSEICIY